METQQRKPAKAPAKGAVRTSLHPLLYQLNTRVLLTDLSQTLGRPATLDDIPDAELDRIAELGFEWVWLLSVWQTGLVGQQISRANEQWRREFEETLPDLEERDIAGSGFAITGYSVHKDLGGGLALVRLRQRLQKRGLKLLLDFVCNHTAVDHPWVRQNPNYYIEGTEEDLHRNPQNYIRVMVDSNELILAHGRDPYFPGWPDTLQLDYSNPAVQEAMTAELLSIAEVSDGVRCDMAMLVLPEVFQRTWGMRSGPFWSEAIPHVQAVHPDFRFMAEVYWDLEWTLQQEGFDYTYDKRLYDRLLAGAPSTVRDHLKAPIEYQSRMARFMENHDEPRAAVAFSPATYKAAAIITYLTPGMRFFHQGQFEGSKKRISPHLIRKPVEPIDQELVQFYERLLSVLKQPVLHQGQWRLLNCENAWEGNWTADCFIAFAWTGDSNERLLVAVNYSPNQSQCYIQLPYDGIGEKTWRLQDQLGDAIYDRDGIILSSRGLYVDLPPYQFHVLSMTSLNMPVGAEN